LDFIGEFGLGDYLKYKSRYGKIEYLGFNGNNELIVHIRWFRIDKKIQKVRKERYATSYHRWILYKSEKVNKSSVFLELL